MTTADLIASLRRGELPIAPHLIADRLAKLDTAFNEGVVRTQGLEQENGRLSRLLKQAQETIGRYEEQWIDEHV